MHYKEITKCRSCTNVLLTTFWTANKEMYIVGFPEQKDTKLLTAPLSLVVCKSCWLVQLKHSVDPDVMYREFWYRSGTNEMMRAALRDVVDSLRKRIELRDRDTVIDIGVNDGTLFEYYSKGITKIGFDPAKNIQKKGINTTRNGNIWIFVDEYFAAKRVRGKSAKVITACGMFYDLDNPIQFVREVKSTLADDGIFVVQMNYLPAMLKNVCIDNVSHEHLTYFSLTSLLTVFREGGLEIFDVEFNDVNGGSIRVYAGNPGKRIVQGVVHDTVIKEHSELLLNSMAPYVQFADRVEKAICEIDQHLMYLYDSKKSIYAYGASTRGTTLLQLLKNTKPILGAAERSEMKWGRLMVGTWTKIVPEDLARREAKVFLILPYSFLPAFINREIEWLKNGGMFLVPLPVVRLLSFGGLKKQNDGTYVETKLAKEK